MGDNAFVSVCPSVHLFPVQLLTFEPNNIWFMTVVLPGLKVNVILQSVGQRSKWDLDPLSRTVF